MEALPPLEDFKYLRQTIAYNNSNWVAIYHNLQKAWMWWVMKIRVIQRTEATLRACGAMYNTVALSVLLYGREIWVVTEEMLNVM